MAENETSIRRLEEGVDKDGRAWFDYELDDGRVRRFSERRPRDFSGPDGKISMETRKTIAQNLLGKEQRL